MSTSAARMRAIRAWLMVALCLAVITAPAAAAAARSAPASVRWLQRVTFGVDSASLAALQRQGPRDFLRAQLAASDGDAALPPVVQAQLQSYPALQLPVEALLAQQAQRNAQIRALPEGADKVAARKALREDGRALVQQVRQAEVLRAIHSPDQLREQLVWFWNNHFSVHAQKGRLGWMLGDYVDNAIRPHVAGHFADLVLATLKSPAMLEYLDNAHNAKGRVNENYARELMELHMLGVDAGYTQQDIQQLALVLTGAGIVPPRRHGVPKLPPALQRHYLREGAFEFNPARHQGGDKRLLGQRVAGGGFDEIERAVHLLAAQPACARFVSQRLAEYFVGDRPPAELVARMARTFQRTDGDLAAVVRTLVESRAFADAAPAQFKDPYRYLVSAARLAYDGQPIVDPRPLVNWLGQMGEPSFGRITPDGWSLQSSSWTSSGQLAKRFEIARALANGGPRLLGPMQAASPAGLAQTPLFQQALAPTLSPATRTVLAQARSRQEWTAFVLASPEFNHR